MSSHGFSHTFPLSAISLPIFLPVLAFFFEARVDLLELVLELDLGLMQFLIELFQLSILDLVGSGEFGNLLGHEVDVGLILTGKSLLL